VNRMADSLSIVIPSKDRIRDLNSCLEALVSQIGPDDEIIVINNGTEAYGGEISSHFPMVRIFEDSTPNLPHLFNRGWSEGRGVYIGFLNDDTIPSNDWCRSMKEWFERIPEAAAIAGPTNDTVDRRMKQLNRKQSILLEAYDKIVLQGRLNDYGILTSWGAYSIGATHPTSPTEVQSLTITNMAVRRQVLVDMGGFDTDYQYSNYDGAFFLKLMSRGLKMYAVPDGAVIHNPNPKGNTRSAYYLARDYAVWYRSMRPSNLKEWLLVRIGEASSILFWVRIGLREGGTIPAAAIAGYLEGRRFVERRGLGSNRSTVAQ
jgi:glycogen(starch) synthase